MDADLKDYLESMENRLNARIDLVVKELKEYVDERTHDAETRLLRSFSDIYSSTNIRLSKMENDDLGFIKLEGGSANGGLRQ